MNIANKNSRIFFHSLHWDTNPDDSQTDIIYRIDTDDTVIIGKYESRLVKYLYKGHTVEETATVMNTTVDQVKKMVEYLIDYGFLKAIDAIKVPELSEKIHPLLLNADRRWFTWVLNPYLFFVNCLIIVTGLVFAIGIPGFLPTVEDFIWTPDITVAFLINISLQYLLILIHEWAHFATTKAIGGEASLSIGYQFIYLVAQTENYRIQSRPRTQRYIVYLAGIFIDFLMIGLIYWFLFLVHLQNVPIGFLEPLLKSLVLVLFAGICWQLNAYLETDIYYVISDYLDQPNLYTDAKKLFIEKITSGKSNVAVLARKAISTFVDMDEVSRASNDLRSFSRKQKSQLWVYIWIFAAGITTTTFYYFFFIFNREVLYLLKGLDMLNMSLSTANFWDAFRAFILIFLILYQYIILLYLIIRKHNKLSLLRAVTGRMHKNK